MQFLCERTNTDCEIDCDARRYQITQGRHWVAGSGCWRGRRYIYSEERAFCHILAEVSEPFPSFTNTKKPHAVEITFSSWSAAALSEAAGEDEMNKHSIMLY